MMEEISIRSIDDFDDMEFEKWKIGESYKIEFFEGIFTPVYLLDANSNINKYLKKMSNETEIFTEFMYCKRNDEKNIPAISLFAFCCSSGVYLFKQKTSTPNQQLKSFLTQKNGPKFIGRKIGEIYNRLQELFGSHFYIQYDNVIQSRLKEEYFNDFNEIVQKFYGEPLIDFNDQTLINSSWNRTLSKKQVMYAAYIVFALSLCYPNFPSCRKQKSVMKKIKISKNSNLSEFDKEKSETGESYNIEFFSNAYTPVYLIDTSTDISKYIKKMSKDKTIYADLKYIDCSVKRKSDNHRIQKSPIICLFSFCCSSGIYLFKQTDFKVNKQLKQFMSKANGKKFIIQRSISSLNRLKKFFGQAFEINLIDAFETRLSEYKNEQMDITEILNIYYDPPKTSFHDRKMKYSNWNRKVLSMKQVLISAFEVYSLSLCCSAIPQDHSLEQKSQCQKAKQKKPSNTREITDDDDNDDDEIIVNMNTNHSNSKSKRNNFSESSSYRNSNSENEQNEVNESNEEEEKEDIRSKIIESEEDEDYNDIEEDSEMLESEEYDNDNDSDIDDNDAEDDDEDDDFD